MKKLRAIALLVALVAISCSVDRTVEVNRGDAISFKAFSATRTDSADSYNGIAGVSDLKYLRIWAYEISDSRAIYNSTAWKNKSVYFENVLFKRGSDGEYHSDVNYFWPHNSNLIFFGYASDRDIDMLGESSDSGNDDYMGRVLESLSPNGQYTTTSTDRKIYGINGPMITYDDDGGTVSEDCSIDNTIEFVMVKTSGSGNLAYYGNISAERTTSFQLQLRHVLSKLIIKGVNHNPNYTYYVKGIRVWFYNPSIPVSFDNSIGDFTNTTSPWYICDGNATGDEKFLRCCDMEYETAIELTSSSGEQYLTGGSDTGLYLYPMETPPGMFYNHTSANEDFTGCRIALKLLIFANDSPYFPAPQRDDESSEEGNAYESYRWACISFKDLPDAMKDTYRTEDEDANKGKAVVFNAGTKYTLTLDLSHGAGYVDPTWDGDTRFKPNDRILGGQVGFKVSVEEWDQTFGNDISDDNTGDNGQGNTDDNTDDNTGKIGVGTNDWKEGGSITPISVDKE